MEELHDEIIRQIENNIDSDREMIEYETGNYGAIPETHIANRSRNEMCGDGLCGSFILGIINIFRFVCSDYIISILVVTFGISATCVTTYMNLFDLTQIIQWSPCLSNQTFNFLKFDD